MKAARIFSFAILPVFLAPSLSFAGYTHYFVWQDSPDEVALANCIAEMKLIIEAKKDILAAAGGEGDPTSETLKVQFNGIGADAHEPFSFPGTNGFNFCKTQWKPYDAVVVACLLVARDHFPPDVLEISSDGQWHDWSGGAALYTSVLGRPARNPLDGRGFGRIVFPVIVVLFVFVLGWRVKTYLRR